jgi:precorrin-2 methylase
MQPTNVTAQYKPGKQYQTRNTMRNTTDPASGRKIPSTVNRRVNRSQNKDSPKDIVTQPRAGIQCLKSNKHAVKIIGDSHLRDSVMRINQYLNSKYEATVFIKPGATTKKIVTSGENEFQGLGEKDVIVLNCGANDIEKVNSSISAIITPVIDFSQKYSNTNIIVLEIPHRHDLHHKEMTNIHIQSFNTTKKHTVKI